MKKLLYLVTGFGLLFLMTGCRSNTCEPSFCQRMWANRPKPNFFRGAPCNTCNPPVGQPANCDANLAPACESCFGNGVELPGPQPNFESTPAPGVPYYPETMMNSPDFSVAPANAVGYPPTQSSTPFDGSSTEIETPPMYGNRNIFN